MRWRVYAGSARGQALAIASDSEIYIIGCPDAEETAKKLREIYGLPDAQTAPHPLKELEGGKPPG